jgi:hypothetical protein
MVRVEPPSSPVTAALIIIAFMDFVILDSPDC